MSRTVLAPADPISAHREIAKERIDSWFNGIATANAHVDQVHAVKRAAAQKIIDGDTTVTALDAEAALRNITPAELAAIIVAKPDELAARELHRQKLLAKIKTLNGVAELEALAVDVSKV
jgi:hypothetical protein